MNIYCHYEIPFTPHITYTISSPSCRAQARGLKKAALLVVPDVFVLAADAEVLVVAPKADRPVGDLALGENPVVPELVVVPAAPALVPEADAAALDDTNLDAAAEEAIDEIIVADIGLLIGPPPAPEDPGDAATCAAAVDPPPIAPGPAIALLRTKRSPYACSYSRTETSIDLFSSASSFNKVDLLASSSVRSVAVAEAAAMLCSLCSTNCLRVVI